MRGYFEGIEANQVTFKACTEMRTGDLGFYDDNGEIVLAGRRDHMLNIKGAKLHPAEIDASHFKFQALPRLLPTPACWATASEGFVWT